MDRIIVYTSPVAPLQKILAIKDGQLIDQVGIWPNDLVETIFAMVQKYDIQDIDFTGIKSFALNFIEEMKQPSAYNSNNLNINFVEDKKTNG